MIDSFKNIERLRYRTNKDNRKLYEEIKDLYKEQRGVFFEELFSAVASAVAALFLTTEVFESLKARIINIYKFIFDKEPAIMVINIISLILCMIILLVVAYGIYGILNYIKKRKEKNKVDGRDKTDYIKEFDNIACDSIFVALEYKEAYINIEEPDLKKMYLFEIIHYLDSASEITNKLCEDNRNIKTLQNVHGVDFYRIRNIKSIMIDLHSFIKSSIENEEGLIDSSDKEVLNNQLEKIIEKINDIRDD